MRTNPDGRMNRVDWLEIDEEVEHHLARHGVRAGDVWEILSNTHLLFPKREHADERIYLLGPTNGGRILKVSLAPTDEPGTWRPITAFPADAADTRLYWSRVR